MATSPLAEAVRPRRAAPTGVARWPLVGLVAVLGSLAVGVSASRHGYTPYLAMAALTITIGAVAFHQHVFGVFLGWIAISGLAWPFIRWPLHHDLATLDRFIIVALGAAVLFHTWPQMATASRRVGIAFGVFALAYGTRSFFPGSVPQGNGLGALAGGESSSIQPQVDWFQNVALAFVVFLIAARTITPERWPKVARALTFLGVTVGIIALAEWALGFELTSISGFAPFTDDAAGIVRVSGPYPTPSAMGAVLIVCLAATVYWMQAERAWLAGSAALVIELAGLAPTFTKTVWGAAFVTVIIVFGLRRQISSRLFIIAFYGAVGAGFIYSLVAKTTVIATRVSGQAADDNFIGRLAAWRQSVDIFQHWPVYGAGIDQFVGAQQFVTPVYVDGVEAVPSAHNTFVSVFAETGLLGTLPLLALVASTLGLIVAYRRRARTEEESLFGATVIGAVVGCFMLSMTFTTIYDPPGTLFLALIVGAMAGRLNAIAYRETRRAPIAAWRKTSSYRGTTAPTS